MTIPAKPSKVQSVSIIVKFLLDDYSSHESAVEFDADVEEGVCIEAMRGCVPAIVGMAQRKALKAIQDARDKERAEESAAAITAGEK